MTKDSKLKLAKVLIALSFVLILLGVGLDLETNILIQPTRNTHTIASSTPADINITTTDTPISETTTTETPQKTPDNNKGTNSSQSSGTGSSNNNNSNNTDNNYQAKKPQQNVTAPETIESKNNTLRNQIENKYNVDIRYGTETNGYAVGGLSTVMLTDANRINALLNELNRNLALYPNGFFKEINTGNYNLSIYLLKRYSQNNVTGITDSTSQHVIISLATDYSYIESLHHELYHYIEKYMYKRGANYTTWNLLNPDGFSYGNINKGYSFTNGNNRNAFFVNDYAQTDPYEDRASTFEYMMAQSEASCLQTGTTIWKKAKYMCEQIDAVFQTVSPNVTEYWERFVYN